MRFQGHNCPRHVRAAFLCAESTARADERGLCLLSGRAGPQEAAEAERARNEQQAAEAERLRVEEAAAISSQSQAGLVALYDFDKQENDDLAIRVGNAIEILEEIRDSLKKP